MTRLLEDRIALVTGGAQGLGKAISTRLAEEGAHVVVCDINEQDAGKTASEIVTNFHRQAIAVKADVTDEAQVEAMINRTVKEFGRLDIAVSNAGILIAEEVTEFPAEKWRAVINVNLFGYFLVAKHAAIVMKEQRRGVILQINSKSGKKGSFKNSAYAASKFGGIGLTQSIALELAEYRRARQFHLSWQPAGLAAVGGFALQAVRQKVGHHRSRSEAEVHRPGADEARLHVRRCVQRSRLLGLRPI